MNSITQLVSPWTDGERTTLQFFPSTRELWTIRRDTTGRVVSREFRALGDTFEKVRGETVTLALSVGYVRHETPATA